MYIYCYAPIGRRIICWAAEGHALLTNVMMYYCAESTLDLNSFWTAFGAIATAFGALAIGFAAYQLRFEAWLKAQEVFTKDDFVEARAAIFQHFDNVDQPWPVNDADAKKVCRKMDELARLKSLVTLPRSKILLVWGNPIAKAWLLLEPTVSQEQQLTHWDKKWKAFKLLGEEAVRRNVSLKKNS